MGLADDLPGNLVAVVERRGPAARNLFKRVGIGRVHEAIAFAREFAVRHAEDRLHVGRARLRV